MLISKVLLLTTSLTKSHNIIMLVKTPNFKLQLNCFYFNITKCGTRVNQEK